MTVVVMPGIIREFHISPAQARNLFDGQLCTDGRGDGVLIAVRPGGRTPIFRSHLIAMSLQENISRKWAMLFMTLVGTSLFGLFGLFGRSHQHKGPIQAIVTVQLLQTLTVQGVIAILNTLSAELGPFALGCF